LIYRRTRLLSFLKSLRYLYNLLTYAEISAMISHKKHVQRRQTKSDAA